MKTTFFSNPLHWKGRGYFAPPVPANDPTLIKHPDASLWLRVQGILDRLKQGHFDQAAHLLDIYEQAQRGLLLRSVCAQLLGDAGTSPCLEYMINKLDDDVDSDRAFDFCNAFEAWGSLSAVPSILQSYDRYFALDEARVLPLTLSLLLEADWGPLSDELSRGEFIAYHQRVMERHGALLQQFGSDKVVLLQGNRFGVVSLARKMLRNLGATPHEKMLQPFYRHRFEASTGLDCSCFYKKEEFQPLTTAAFLERFLESSEAARYEEGVRYFFGHRIPE